MYIGGGVGAGGGAGAATGEGGAGGASAGICAKPIAAAASKQPIGINVRVMFVTFVK